MISSKTRPCCWTEGCCAFLLQASSCRWSSSCPSQAISLCVSPFTRTAPYDVLVTCSWGRLPSQICSCPALWWLSQWWTTYWATGYSGPSFATRGSLSTWCAPLRPFLICAPSLWTDIFTSRTHWGTPRFSSDLWKKYFVACEGQGKPMKISVWT